MTEQVENKHKDFMEDVGFSSIQELYELLDGIYWELYYCQRDINERYGAGDERSDLLDVSVSSIRVNKAIVYNVKEGVAYPFLLEPTVLWVLAPAIAQVKEDLDHVIERVDDKALVKQLKKNRRKVKKLIKRIGPGVVKHCISDSTGFLLKAMALHECGPECENHGSEEGDVA